MAFIRHRIATGHDASTAGDYVVQRGTEHARRNTGDGPLTLSAVMIGVGSG